MSPEQIAERGHHAKRLLEDGALNSVFEEILADSYRRWLATTSDETAQREAMHLRARGIQAIRTELQDRVDLATKTAADQARKEQRKKEI